jgi:hypothetical protein
MAPKSGTRKNKLAQEFCRCIKRVRKTVKVRPGQPKTAAQREAAAIAICVQSVLQTRGKTLKRFSCRGKNGPTLTTQKPLKGGSALVGSHAHAHTPSHANKIKTNVASNVANVTNLPTNLNSGFLNVITTMF